jgi:hypothetical protein
MQRGSAGAELLEDHQRDPIGIDLERDRQVLPAEVAAERVDSPGQQFHQVNNPGYGLDVGGGQQAGLQPAATHPE